MHFFPLLIFIAASPPQCIREPEGSWGPRHPNTRVVLGTIKTLISTKILR